MSKNNLTVDVKVNITVSTAEAEACLKLVELYINQNNAYVIENPQENGTIQLNFQERDNDRR